MARDGITDPMARAGGGDPLARTGDSLARARGSLANDGDSLARAGLCGQGGEQQGEALEGLGREGVRTENSGRKIGRKGGGRKVVEMSEV